MDHMQLSIDITVCYDKVLKFDINVSFVKGICNP